MSAAFKRSVEKFIHNLQRSFLRYEACRHRNNITVVVLTAKVRYLGCPAKGTTHIGVLINGHLNSIATTTNNYATTIFAFVDSATQLMGKVGVVTAFGTIGTKVFHFETLINEILFNNFF